MILSASNLAILRQQPHNTKLYLSVYQPTTVMACTLNTGTVGRGDRTIPYVSVTTGSISNVEADYTLLVGTTAGARDVGTVRIRSGTASTFLVAENSDIQWSAGQYLTVLKYVDIWPVYPVIDNSTDPEVPVFYKDTDVPYTNQNSILGSFPVMGCHQAIKTGGNAYWSASGTYNVLGDSLAYTWEFEGGSPATSSAKTPGLVSYAAAGNYVTKLTVSGSSGGVDVSYRYVIVEDNPSVLKWELTSLRGSRAEGGYIASVKVYQILDSIKDGALVMIWADDTYGATKVSLGGNSPSASQVVFVGYIQKGSITYNWRESSVEFEIGSVTEIMKAAEGFGVSVESKTSPTTWYELLNATVTRFIYHYLRWHTTVLKVADFRYTGQDYSVQYFDSDRASLYDALYSFVNQSLHADVVADRQGAIWVEIGAKAIDSAKSLPLAMSLDKQDWMGDPTIEERLFSETSYVEGGGIAFSGATGSFAPFKGCSPGNSPSYRGKSENLEGMIVTGQDHLNRIVGNIYAYENSRYPVETFKLAGNYRNLNIAPLERVTISLAREENARGVVWNNESFHITGIDWEYDEKNGFFSPTVTFAQLTEGVAGETIVIPPTPPEEGYSSDTNISIPKIPSFVFPAFSIPQTTEPFLHGATITLIRDNGVDFNPATVGESFNGQNFLTYNRTLLTPQGQAAYLAFVAGAANPIPIYEGMYMVDIHVWSESSNAYQWLYEILINDNTRGFVESIMGFAPQIDTIGQQFAGAILQYQYNVTYVTWCGGWKSAINYLGRSTFDSVFRPPDDSKIMARTTYTYIGN